MREWRDYLLPTRAEVISSESLTAERGEGAAAAAALSTLSCSCDSTEIAGDGDLLNTGMSIGSACSKSLTSAELRLVCEEEGLRVGGRSSRESPCITYDHLTLNIYIIEAMN